MKIEFFNHVFTISLALYLTSAMLEDSTWGTETQLRQTAPAESNPQSATQDIHRLPTAAVIRTDLRYAIALSVRHLNSLFDRDRNNVPFFGTAVLPEGTGRMDYGALGFRLPQITGRCLLGCLLAEDVTGIPCPEPGLKILESFHRQQFDNEDHLNSYLDPSKDNQRFIQLHNLREGLFGLHHLAKGRNREWAREKADRMVETLLQITDEEGRISLELAKQHGIAERLVGHGPDAVTNGRAVDPLVEYHRYRGNPRALQLAGLFARGTLQRSFETNGRFKPQPNPESTGHIHSLTSSLSGIALYAEVTNNQPMIDWVTRIVDLGVPEYSTSWGWMVEGMHGDQKKGEMNQTGDVIRTALALARSGQRGYYELAERWTRNMLLHAQHREEEMQLYLKDNPHPQGDRERNVLNRNIGGYGIKLPNARMRAGEGWALSTLDIASGAVHALCEVWKNRVTIDDQEIKINLLFDYGDDEIELDSSLPLMGRLRFFQRTNKSLSVRIPDWVDRDTLRLEVQGQTVPKPKFADSYLQVGTLPPGQVGTIWFNIPQSVTRETVDGQIYTATWWGNQVIDITPRGACSPIPY